MTINPDASFSRADVMREIAALKQRIQSLETARRLEAASVGRGGLRVHSGGTIRIQNPAGADTFVAASDSLTLRGLLQVLGGGDISVTDGRLVASDEDGEVFAVDPTVPRIFMRPELIDALSAEVLGARVRGDTITDSDLIDTDAYDDIATIGPTTPAVTVTAGILIVWPSGSLNVAANSGDSFSAAAYMSYQISGPTNVAPSDERAARLSLITTSEPSSVVARSGGAFVHTGLAAGNYTVRAKYRVDTGDENQASANDRTLVVLGI